MPLYFFHYQTTDRYTRDDTGCDFDTLELAYLDAYRSMIDIGAELLKRQQNPALHRIDIADRSGQILMGVCFSEIFKEGRRRVSPVPSHVAERRATLLDDYRRLRDASLQLRDDLDAICASARLSVVKAHELLRRAKSIA